MPLAWRLLDQSFCITHCHRGSTPAQPCQGAARPFLVLGDGDDTTVVSISPGPVNPADQATPGALWRALLLDHADVSLPTRILARTCMALDAAGVPLALASLPGQTMLLFPATLAGRALAALHQAGVDRITI
ncbi:MAG: hypothetical protein MUF10_07635 [Thermoanaerobaculaceae bacterium]|nr:hypothetical protein [Thermoanaerobaculaceae bacterium]